MMVCGDLACEKTTLANGYKKRQNKHSVDMFLLNTICMTVLYNIGIFAGDRIFSESILDLTRYINILVNKKFKLQEMYIRYIKFALFSKRSVFDLLIY